MVPTFDEAMEAAHRVYVAAWFDEHPEIMNDSDEKPGGD